MIDAPCSATGVIRRHPDIKILRRPADLDRAVLLQARLLRALWPLLAPGGRLVYATCSLEPEENDAQIESFLADNPTWKLEPPPHGAVPDAVLDAGRLRVLPQRHGADGSFAARLRRGES